jgi:hypothetical protein
MTPPFDDNRHYVLGDPELLLIGDREKLAQWRHRNVGPPYFKLGRKIIYCGKDLNVWAEQHWTDPEARDGRDG